MKNMVAYSKWQKDHNRFWVETRHDKKAVPYGDCVCRRGRCRDGCCTIASAPVRKNGRRGLSFVLLFSRLLGKVSLTNEMFGYVLWASYYTKS